MISTDMQQRLCEMPQQYGRVRDLQMFDSGSGSDLGCLVLATMDGSENAMTAQAALGVHTFGMDALIFSERRLRHTFGQG